MGDLLALMIDGLIGGVVKLIAVTFVIGLVVGSALMAAVLYFIG